MNLLLKTAVLLLVTTSVFAATKNLEQMKQDIASTKNVYAEDCKPVSDDILKQLAMDPTPACLKEIREIRKALCSRKAELISYLEAITSKSNVTETAKRFGEVPPADALGGVLLWQMRSSIDQVNGTWAQKVDRMKLRPKCYSEKANRSELRAELIDQTTAMKNEIAQTTLMVDSEQK